MMKMLKKIDKFADKHIAKISLGVSVLMGFFSGTLLITGILTGSIIPLVYGVLTLILAIFYSFITYYLIRFELLDELMLNYGTKSKENN